MAKTKKQTPKEILVKCNKCNGTGAVGAHPVIALIEKNKQPFNPAHCGEMLFDIEAEPLNLDKIGCQKNEINKIIIKIPPKNYTFKFKKHRIIIFDRNFVEKKFLETAEKKGTDLFLGIKMIDFKPPDEIVMDNNEIIKGKVIIDASGILCQVGKRIEIKTKLDKKPEPTNDTEAAKP